MRWTHLVAAVIVVSSAAACLAETPEFANNRPQAMQLFQGKLLGGQSWWSRYGEPVNSTALANAESSVYDKNASGGPVPMYGDGSYVYGPGTCDCSPPCIGHLWAGYFQNPKRCHSHQLLHRHCGCNSCDDGCGSCGPLQGMLGRIFGHGCCGANSCTSSVSCGCAAPTCTTSAPTCTAAADCGCKPVCGKCRSCHLGDRWRGFMAHWSCGCDSCSSPVSCGCATPAAAAPSSEKQASQGLPSPMPEEAAVYPLRRLH